MNRRVFFDTNIVADIIDSSRQNHTKALELASFLIDENITICISEDMITTLYYISKDKHSTLQFLQNVVFEDWEILNFSKAVLKKATQLSLTNGADLEDLLQSLCAKEAQCEAIYTNDTGFYSDEVLIRRV